MKKRCECCDKKIIAMSNQKFCTNCAIYVRELKRDVCYNRKQVKELKNKFYELK